MSALSATNSMQVPPMFGSASSWCLSISDIMKVQCHHGGPPLSTTMVTPLSTTMVSPTEYHCGAFHWVQPWWPPMSTIMVPSTEYNHGGPQWVPPWWPPLSTTMVAPTEYNHGSPHWVQPWQPPLSTTMVAPTEYHHGGPHWVPPWWAPLCITMVVPTEYSYEQREFCWVKSSRVKEKQLSVPGDTSIMMGGCVPWDPSGATQVPCPQVAPVTVGRLLGSAVSRVTFENPSPASHSMDFPVNPGPAGYIQYRLLLCFWNRNIHIMCRFHYWKLTVYLLVECRVDKVSGQRGLANILATTHYSSGGLACRQKAAMHRLTTNRQPPNLLQTFTFWNFHDQNGCCNCHSNIFSKFYMG